MLLYKNLLKELDENLLEEKSLKEVEKFGLSGVKKLTAYSIAIPLISIGLFQIYSFTLSHKWYIFVIGLIFLAIGLKHLKNLLVYGIRIYTESGRIKSGKLDIMVKDVEEATLKEMKIGKKVLPILKLLTNEKRQFIIILLMSNQVRFLNVIKILLKDKFKIEK